MTLRQLLAKAQAHASFAICRLQTLIKRLENKLMDRKTVIMNLVNNYGKYGVTENMISQLLDDGLKAGLNYDLMYLNLEAELSKRYGKEFFCTSQDMARAFGVSEEEMNKIIEESREELIEAGENPDEYFKMANSTKYLM